MSAKNGSLHVLQQAHLLLRLHGALQERFHARLKILNLLPLKAVELSAHEAPHVFKEQPGLVYLALGIGNLSVDLIEPILLASALAQQLILRRLPLLKLRLGRAPAVERLLA